MVNKNGVKMRISFMCSISKKNLETINNCSALRNIVMLLMNTWTSDSLNKNRSFLQPVYKHNVMKICKCNLSENF